MGGMAALIYLHFCSKKTNPATSDAVWGKRAGGGVTQSREPTAASDTFKKPMVSRPIGGGGSTS